MNHGIVNLCKDNGTGGMSECSKAGQGYEAQKRCSFCTGKSTGGNHCVDEVFGEFCRRIPAQKHSRGLPIMLDDVKSGHEPVFKEDDIKKASEWAEEVCNVDELTIDDLGDMLEQMDEEEQVIEGMEWKDHMLIDNSGSISREQMETVFDTTKEMMLTRHPMLDSIDIEIPYKDENGKIRHIASKDYKKFVREYKEYVLSSEMKTDPCSKCLIVEECSSNPCMMKKKYNLESDCEVETALQKHEMFHKMVQMGRRKKLTHSTHHIDSPDHVVGYEYNHQYPIHCHDHSQEFVNDRGMTVRVEKCRNPEVGLEHGKCALVDVDRQLTRRREGHGMWIEEPRYYGDGRQETEYYMKSRKISAGNIMERYHGGFITVVTSEQLLRVLPRFKNKKENLLFDSKYLVFYQASGDLAWDETYHFLRNVQCKWRKLIPKEALPKYSDYAMDFGFRRVAKANFDSNYDGIFSKVDERHPKKDVCKECALGWKYCSNPCSNYLVS